MKSLINKDNSSKQLFKTVENSSTIRGQQRNNRNKNVKQKQTPTYIETVITSAIFLI